jgi:UDP-GlcNAc:undecaprenyl-phosphate GlcNAc-1-phosphate transferase
MEGVIRLAFPYAVGLGLSVALVPVSRLLAIRTGVVAHPRNDRWHREVVPLLGGVAIGLAILLGAFVLGIARDTIVPLTACMAIFVMGLVDDILALKPFTKLIGQIAMAAAVVYFDYRLYWLDSRLLDSVLTMVWLVGLTNAFNLLDNMDGLCAGIALVVAVMLMVGLATGASRDFARPEIAFLALMAGAVSGFLIFNFPPASIFMGDSGALMLGFGLAMLTLGNDGVRGSRSDVVSAIAGPVFVLMVPIFDTTLVTVLRLLAGRSPAMGGRDHSSHRLVAMGLSERSAVVVLWLLAAIGGGIGVVLRSASDGVSLAAGAAFVLLMCVLAFLLARVRVYDQAHAPAKSAGFTLITSDLPYKRRVFEVLVDVTLAGAAYYLANRLQFDREAFAGNAENFYGSLPIVLAAQLVGFFIVGVYRGTWDHFKRKDRMTFLKGVALGAAISQLGVLALYGYYSYSISVFLIYTTLLALLMVAARTLVSAVEGFFD